MTERKGQNEERRKKADGTIYDDVLRTIQERHGELLIPVVNDAFGMHYGKNEKEFYAYLPFYLMRYEKELRKLEQNERYASELASECGRLLERLELALYDNPGTFQDLLRLMRRVTEYLLYGRERLKREVGEVMGGKVLELPTDKLREERETGRAEGRTEGDVFRLISQVRRKMLRRKPFDEICKELEEEAKHIRPICEVFLKKGLDCPEEEIYKEL